MLNLEDFRKYIVILKPNCEFLMWELSTSKFHRRNITRLNPFMLFKIDIQEIMNKKSLRPNFNNRKIIETWSNADEEVRLEYENLYLQYILQYKISQLGTLKPFIIFFYKN